MPQTCAWNDEKRKAFRPSPRSSMACHHRSGESHRSPLRLPRTHFSCHVPILLISGKPSRWFGYTLLSIEDMERKKARFSQATAVEA